MFLKAKPLLTERQRGVVALKKKAISKEMLQIYIYKFT